MAKGFEKHQERMQKISLFGKDLVRRSGSRCELCETGGVKLSVFEVGPVNEEPDFDHCIFICDNCREQIEKPKRMNADHWRCLNNTIWTEIPAVQAQAVRILTRLEGEYPWAADLLEQSFMSEDILDWANSSK